MTNTSPDPADSNAAPETTPEATVQKIAALARLDITPDEVGVLAGQFATIIEHFEVLVGVDVEGIAPMSGATGLSDVMRDDQLRPSLAPDAVLKNAPEREGDYYSVPKTVGGDA
jgi:aspartyl-tRNA(Asn)/glutamyl-tRNA(Gln) amidotransferase subunit C